jgi:mannose-6-phosphate isomerase-like protein (cupin superfamily)
VYIGEDKDLGVTALRVNVHGSHPLKRMTGDTVRMYYVVRGQGEFVLNGIAQKVTEGDCAVIEPGGEYSYTGEMTLFEVNSSKSHTYTDEKL